jgi:hypothetical protein
MLDIRRVADRPLLVMDDEQGIPILKGLPLDRGKRYPVFLYFEPKSIEVGERQPVHVIQRDPETQRIEGGCAYHVVLVPKDGH